MDNYSQASPSDLYHSPRNPILPDPAYLTRHSSPPQRVQLCPYLKCDPHPNDASTQYNQRLYPIPLKSMPDTKLYPSTAQIHPNHHVKEKPVMNSRYQLDIHSHPPSQGGAWFSNETNLPNEIKSEQGTHRRSCPFPLRSFQEPQIDKKISTPQIQTYQIKEPSSLHSPIQPIQNPKTQSTQKNMRTIQQLNESSFLTTIKPNKERSAKRSKTLYNHRDNLQNLQDPIGITSVKIKE